MQAVNLATTETLEQFRKKAADLPFNEHPYSSSKRALERIGKVEWDEEHRNAATAAMALWVKMIIVNSTVITLNEIVALMKIAAETGDEEHKKAADEMASSMSFMERVFHQYIEQVDERHIAEQLFADGLKKEQEIAAETAAAEAAKEKVKAFNATKQQPLSGTVHRPNRWEPSAN